MDQIIESPNYLMGIDTPHPLSKDLTVVTIYKKNPDGTLRVVGIIKEAFKLENAGKYLDLVKAFNLPIDPEPLQTPKDTTSPLQILQLPHH